MKTDTPTIILASQSPRRAELLKAMGVSFKVIPSAYEEVLDHARPTEEVALELGRGKALAVARQHPAAVVIGSDTIVTLDGTQYGKAATPDEERAVLRLLAGRTHTVITSLVIIRLDQQFSFEVACRTDVVVKPWNDADVEAYIALEEWRDKAVYSVQAGYSLIDHLEGRYDVVLGLPTVPLAEQLMKLGVQAHAVTPPCPVPVIAV